MLICCIILLFVLIQLQKLSCEGHVIHFNDTVNKVSQDIDEWMKIKKQQQATEDVSEDVWSINDADVVSNYNVIIY